MNPTSFHPQNPYQSILVSASAGSGKTYQLSRRFLALVSAGAQPSSILTVTFSRKAAAEMRSRVIADAIAYGNADKAFAGFHEELSYWRKQALHEGLNVPELLDAKAVSQLIVQNTQSLAITTIDGILMEWCLKFPLESAQTSGEASLISPWNITSSKELFELQKMAWQRTLSSLPKQSELSAKDFYESVLASAPGNAFKTAWQRLESLIKSDTFIWLAESLRGHASLSYEVSANEEDLDETALVSRYAAELAELIGHVTNPEKRGLGLAAINNRSYKGLEDAAILKKDGTLHGTTISKRIRAAAPRAVDVLESAFRRFKNQEKLRRLNAHARLLWLLYRVWCQELLTIKATNAQGNFSDLLKGVYQIFTGDFPGPRWLLGQRAKHILLDEFQDTSRLQWSAFRELANEILSGRSSDQQVIPGTVFIVGDAKQSIYGFREADPEILELAHEDLESLGLAKISMSDSWRTANIILEFVNTIFQTPQHADPTKILIPDFPKHQTASVSGKVVVPDCGSIHVLPLVKNSEEETGPALEAKQVSNHIKAILEGSFPTPIWDKKQRTFRAPRPEDFAILYPKSTHADVLEDELRSLAIPAVREEKRGYFERQEIKDCLSLMRWLAIPADTASLCSVLKSPFCAVSDEVLQTLIQTTAGDVTLSEQAQDSKLSSLVILKRLEATHPKTATLLHSLLLSERSLSCFDIFCRWFKETTACTSYLEAFGERDGKLAEANLLKFLEILRSAESQGMSNLHDVLLHCDALISENETGNASVAHNAVHLMTVHKSKGLEFPIVILVDTANDWFRSETNWLRSTMKGQEGFYYIGTKEERPEGEPQIDLAISLNEGVQRAEKARLLYVALTRAQQHLVVSGSFKTTKELALPPADSFYMRLRDAAGALTQGSSSELAPDTDLRLEREILQAMQNTTLPVATREQDQLLSSAGGPEFKLEHVLTRGSSGFKDAPPALNILRTLNSVTSQSVSVAKPALSNQEAPVWSRSAATVYGTAVHRILELSSEDVHAASRPTLESLLSYLRNNQKESLGLAHDELESVAKTALHDAALLVKSNLWRALWSESVSTLKEASFAVTMRGKGGVVDFKIGQPDLVSERRDGTWWVVDYKTALPPSENLTELFQFSEEQGYGEQVRGYREALTRLLPGKVIKSFILFTRAQQLLEIP